jgi:hypothetical protein
MNDRVSITIALDRATQQAELAGDSVSVTSTDLVLMARQIKKLAYQGHVEAVVGAAGTPLATCVAGAIERASDAMEHTLLQALRPVLEYEAANYKTDLESKLKTARETREEEIYGRIHSHRRSPALAAACEREKPRSRNEAHGDGETEIVIAYSNHDGDSFRVLTIYIGSERAEFIMAINDVDVEDGEVDKRFTVEQLWDWFKSGTWPEVGK